MSELSRQWLLWAPRVLATVVCAFSSLFALDAGGNAEFVVHIAPTVLLLVVVAISWRWEWVGGGVFTVLGIVYAYIGREHVPWVLLVSVPLIVVGALYGWNWRHHQELHAQA